IVGGPQGSRRATKRSIHALGRHPVPGTYQCLLGGEQLMSVAAADAPETRLPDELTTILSRRSVRAAYQPIVDLETGETVAFEALARGPVGSPLENPAALFGTARSCGRLA